MVSKLAVIQFLEPGDPNYPSNALPGGGYPSQGLPNPGYPTGGPVLPPGGVTLPVFPFDPTDPGYGVGGPVRPGNELPNAPVRPGNELPSPGRRYIVKWLACTGLILVPDNSLPETAEPK